MSITAAEAIHHRICPLCEACCGLEISVRAGTVVGIRGHAADVLSRGYICPKAVALKDLHEDPDRLRAPLIKRDGVFEPATWTQAFALIEQRLPPLLQSQGRQAAALVIGNPAAHKIGLGLYFQRLARALGTRNVFSASTLDQIPRHLVSGLLYGHWMSVPVPDIERCDFLIVLGANPAASNGSMWTVPDFRGKAKALRARGGRLVVIDPRRSETAALADEHDFIRPGADVYLLLGMVQTLFAERLVAVGRVGALFDGIAQVEAAVAPFDAQTVAARCGLPAERIRALARSLAGTPRAAIYARIGTCTQEFGSLCTWLVDLLNALTGHLDEPGGVLFPMAPAFGANTQGIPGSGRGVQIGRHRSRVGGLPEVMGELPITCLAEEIENGGPGQVRALFSVASNPVLSAPNGARLARALDSLDFMVSLDIYVNETTRHADVILPAPSPLEELHYDVAFAQLSWRNQARYSLPVLAREAGQPSEWQTLLTLASIAAGGGAQVDAARMDDELFVADMRRQFGDLAPRVLEATAGLVGPERLLEVALRSGPYGDGFGADRADGRADDPGAGDARPQGLNLARLKAAAETGGIDLGPLAPRLPALLRTTDGRIGLAPRVLLDDLPRAHAALARARPDLVVIGRRDVRSNNSWMHNLPVLAKGPMRCTALLHPQDARRLGLHDGSRARIAAQTSSGERSIEAQVQVSADMMPGVISLPHGWGHDLPGTALTVAGQRPGANLNALMDENLRDRPSGNAVLSGIPVHVSALP
jgi:anaerobic selenocysteine-containing dehydrogenase